MKEGRPSISLQCGKGYMEMILSAMSIQGKVHGKNYSLGRKKWTVPGEGFHREESLVMNTHLDYTHYI